VTRQRDYFRRADAAKYRWQTGAPLFAETERRLVSAAAGPGTLLELGCGEGANLFHLGSGPGLTLGIDASLAKTAFASRAVPWARFVCGDAACLPFRDQTFDRVLCRDVLHHLARSSRFTALQEMLRVCRSGGEVVILEPNGRNVLIAALALAVPAERGLLDSTPARLLRTVRRAGWEASLEMRQALPLFRVLLHYRLGMPRLGRWRPAAWMFECLEAVARRVVPAGFWAYVLIRGKRPTAGPGL
jgi:ubiquinone/menaquinone biosynthesis C-methylase UbiE